MSIRFIRANNQRLTAPDGPINTFPNAAWAAGCAIVLDGSYDGGDPQLFFSTGALATGCINIAYMGPGHSTPHTIGYWNSSSSTVRYATGQPLLGRTEFFCVLGRDGAGAPFLAVCPILATAPVDGSAVTVIPITTSNLAASYEGTGNTTIGSRADGASTRAFDHSLARMFVYDGNLTTHQIARLAYGEDIENDLGLSTRMYLRMDNGDDIVDYGQHAATFTKVTNASTAPPTTGTAPSFGYTAPPPNSAPNFTSDPALSGTPYAGTPVSFASGTVTGYPTPALTQEWLIDGAVVGAGATYTPLEGDIGKTLSVRQTATSTQGSDTATSAGAVVQAVAVGAYVVNDIANHRIFQRIGTSAVVDLSGTYIEAPVTVEARLYGVDGVSVLLDWTPLANLTLDAGPKAWTAKLTAPQNSVMYRLSVRFKDSGGSVTNTIAVLPNQWGVGVIFACLGSSSAEGWFGVGQYVVSGISRKFENGSWAQHTGTNGAIVLFCNAMTAQLGVPVGVVASGVSGSTLQDWLNNSSSWNKFTTYLGLIGGKLEAVLCTVGSNDAANGAVTSRASHLSRLQTLYQKVRDACGQPSLVIFHSGYNRRLAANPTASDYVRMAENDAGELPSVYHGPTFDLELSGDGTHLNGNGYRDTMLRTAYVFQNLYSTGSYKRGPKITGITYSGSGATVTIEHRNGSDVAPAAYSAFTASDGLGPLTVSASRVDATRIALAFERQVSGVLSVKHAAGAAPDPTAPVLDNGATALPLAVETDMQATQSSVDPDPPRDPAPSFTASRKGRGRSRSRR